MYGLNQEQACQTMNQLGQHHRPFVFILSYDLAHHYVIPLDELDSSQLLLQTNQFSSFSIPPQEKNTAKKISWSRQAMAFKDYQRKHDQLMHFLKDETIHLANLTCQTPVQSSFTLKEIYQYARSPYKLWLHDQSSHSSLYGLEFVCFSPETFIQIKNNKIHSFPMKGTIDASLTNAKEQLLNNPKELHEHQQMIVSSKDDLSQISDHIKLERFRYISQVNTSNGIILQTSSEVSGQLKADYQEQLGDLLFKLLPAGSTTGYPKTQSIKILKTIENYQRGFYTGVAGVYDGKNLDSFVLIRFIEKIDNILYFKSGGGITRESKAINEYEEMLKKIYVPIY